MTIAFFDFDGTLLQRDSVTICALPSLRRGLISPRMALRLVGGYALSKAKVFPRSRFHHLAFEVYAGRTRGEIERLAQVLHDEHLRPWLSPASLAAVAEHRARGERLVIATAAGRFFAEPLARELGFEAVLGTELVFEGERCTGRVDGAVLDGPAKLARAAAYAEAQGIALDACTFYSDHVADLPLLEAVGTPIAVGPHPPLARAARERGWRVVPHHHG